KGAISDFTKAIDLDPKNGEVYYNRAYAYYKLKNYDLALVDVHRAQKLGFEVDPRFLDALKEFSSST
ncbi:MAG: tetratricopeptide repeat protein, partial [Candidatus Omnitrophica bacterium]|nr:tetratricopeptide repeat protein [Candidatus Omnitrophota bacterium]